MQDRDKIEFMLHKAELAKRELRPEGTMNEGIRLTLGLIVDYIEFMLTPCEDAD